MGSRTGRGGVVQRRVGDATLDCRVELGVADAAGGAVRAGGGGCQQQIPAHVRLFSL